MMREQLVVIAAALMILTGCGDMTAAEELPVQGESESTAVQTEAADMQSGPEDQEKTEEQAFTSMELEIEKGTLYIRSGDMFSLTRHGGDAVPYEIDEGTLYFENSDTEDTVLTLPEGSTYETMLLTVGEGHVYGEAPLTLTTLKVESRRGETSLKDVSVSENSVFQVRQGSVFVSGDLGGTVTVSCQEGHLSLEVPFAQSDSNYEIDLSEGDLQLGGKSYHGRAVSQTVDNGAERSMQLTCSRGEISVEFDR